MSFLFSTRQKPIDILNAQRQEINDAMMELARERRKLETEKKHSLDNLKAKVQAGEDGTARSIARDVATLDVQINELLQLELKLKNTKQMLSRVFANMTMQNTIFNTTKVLTRCNGSLDIAGSMNMVKEFDMQMNAMSMKSQIIQDAVDVDSADGELVDIDSATETILARAKGENSLDIHAKLPTVSGQPTVPREPLGIASMVARAIEKHKPVAYLEGGPQPRPAAIPHHAPRILPAPPSSSTSTSGFAPVNLLPFDQDPESFDPEDRDILERLKNLKR